MALLLYATLLAAWAHAAHGELLTPPYFNLAEGRRISATATCGDGDNPSELYCKLVGATAEDNQNIIHGQACDRCDQNIPNKWHPAENAIDGSTRWWQSPPLSRGSKYNEVNLTIDLGQEFHVAYVFIRMGNSPRPGVWALERSIDNGLTYQPWQFFADTPSDCENYFGAESLKPITRDDSVICDTQFSKVVPLEGGEMFAFIVKNRPSSNSYFNSTVLQEWSRATNIRLRLLRTKTLLGHLMSVVQRQDPTVTRRYFYSIKDISIGGRCVCNGHADTCDISDPTDPYKLMCRCQHNTCGAQCEQCCPGSVQKAWRQSKAFQVFQCEPCNCFGHSDECEYDPEVDARQESLDIHGRYEGGGVCQQCRDNTEGVNCDRCKPGFYRPYGVFLNDTNVCQPCQCDYFYATGNCMEGSGQCECKTEFQEPNCDSCSFGHFGYPDCRPCECHMNGTRGFQCEANGGQCPCKQGYSGTFCNSCAEGHYNFPECTDCTCNAVGSLSPVCNLDDGQCSCKNNFGGRSCDTCQDGYFGYPECEYCSCDHKGTEPGVCDKESGQCLCKEGYGGARCDQCIAGFYGYPDCKPCGCSENGSISLVCEASGRCRCRGNFAGRTCDQCSPGYFKYPECLACNCDGSGSIGISCNNEGTCQCSKNFDGIQCERCKEGFYNFPLCEECNCDPAGVAESFEGCGSVPAGELCECKNRVQGRICNECRPLFWNLQAYNPQGCEECSCNLAGTIGGIGVCDTKSGQCVCKPSVTSRRCEECADGTYNLMENNLFGCTDCQCDVGGSVNSKCDKVSGQCLCQPRVTGRTCQEPLQTHYFPTLYQLQHEAEDGHTPAGTAVRFAYNDTEFRDYSWKGYAVFSQLQNEIVHDLYIQKPSLYRMVMRYVNHNPDAVVGYITIKPEHPGSDVDQSFKVLFKPTSEPELVTVADPVRGIPSHLVMNPGAWHIHTKIDKPNVFLDYFVLLPSAFYEANILVSSANMPCTMTDQSLCTHYRYPSCNRFDIVKGEAGFIDNAGFREKFTEYFTDEAQLDRLGLSGDFPLINQDQNLIHVDMRITKPGQYVVLLNYFSSNENPDPSVIQIVTSTQTGRDKGKVVLYQCRYNTICRQAVTDRDGKVAVFNFDSNSVGIELRGDNMTDVALDSVVAIPFEKWHLDYIKPKAACVKKDNECLTSTFPLPPSSKKVEFEEDNERMVASDLPPGIVDPDAVLVYLGDSVIDIAGKVPQEGKYVFVVHFYQPDFPEFEMEGLVHNGQMYEIKLPVTHCPSNSGCRAVIKHAPDGNHEFQLTQNFHLTLREQPGKGLWLDYVLVIPAEDYYPEVLQEEPLDQTGVFISQCGKNNFHMEPQESGFCRDATFSLTTDFNNGALPCQCDFEGSLSFECDKFGGQCQCKDNVIGRKCQACKTGFFGFPNCKACDCPSTALCNPDTGACICPPQVTGEKCDQCMPETFGFHPILGCEMCNCDTYGVKRGNLQCDMDTGLCDCKDRVVGRTCDQCEAGSYSFPYCDQCNCDLRGTTPDICDQTNAQCHCKENVYRAACDYCIDGTFNLKESNPLGCSKCFCFGKASHCTSSSYYYTPEMQMDGWTVALVPPEADVVNIEVDLDYTEYTVTAELTSDDIISKIVHFSAPEDYLGRKLHAYGGHLKYSVLYNNGVFGAAVHAADVILRGAGMELVHYSLEQPAGSQLWTNHLQLLEENFQLQSGSQATREQIMQVLHSLTGIYIRATYWESTISVKLENVTIDVAVEPQNALTLDYSALDVEECTCPPNYEGLSCEDCAPGYFRAQTGPYGGFCTPCQCNGHADTCDSITGVCIDCRHNSTGDHCEMCEVGFYGDAQKGTPFDCLICACPLPIGSNNFATSCLISEDEKHISCTCRPGYAGPRCESCAAGFYGRPEVEGDFCKPCECSGNIITDDPSSCDSVSGECTRCLNNSFGASCEICAPGFFGDAVELKDCQTCSCNECGTESCESYNGQCKCMPNVIGAECDRCAYEHWNFDSCQGCTHCQCGEASESSQCDEKTGQCSCKPGVTGQRCERCAPGFWNYTPEGCSSCGCNTNFSLGLGCNPLTGQCECLPGVEGEKCDRCPHRWVLIPDSGCYGCDSCIDNLLDVTDELKQVIDPVMDEFDTVALGYFTTQRLIFINDSVNDLQPKVITLDPGKVDLKPMTNEVEALEQDHRSINRRAQYAAEKSKKLNGDKIYADALEVEELVNQAVHHAQQIVMEVNSLAYSLDGGASPQAAIEAVQEAEAILAEIRSRDLGPSLTEANESLEKVQVLLQRMKDFALPVANQTAELEQLRDQVEDFSTRMEDLKRHADETIDKSIEHEDLNLSGKSARLANKVDRVKNSTSAADGALDMSKELNKESDELLSEAKEFFEKMNAAFQKGEQAINKLNDSYVMTEKELEDVVEPVEEAQDHADKINNRAKELDALLADTRDISKAAIEAANAYKNIVDSIDKGLEASRDAVRVAESSKDMTEGTAGTAGESREKSEELLERAKRAHQKAEEELRPQLEEAQAGVADVQQLNQHADRTDSEINRQLENIPQASNLEVQTREAMRSSVEADQAAQNALSGIEGMVNQLPAYLDDARQIPKDVDDTVKKIASSTAHVDRVNKVVPDIGNLIETVKQDLEQLQDKGKDVGNQIEELKKKVVQARDLANRIKVGVTFFPNTTLELRNPEGLPLLATSTKISTYFRTNRPNGFILYLGNAIGTHKISKRSKTDDFIALEIENGYPLLVMDLGSGPQRIVSEKYVADNIWYQAIIERTGKSAKLTIRQEGQEGKALEFKKEEALTGTHTILNLDQEHSKLFVGGYPTSFSIQDSVKYSSFEGQIEDLVIGDTPVGLWNFADAVNNENAAIERDTLVNLQTSTGLRFDGEGYAELNADQYIRPEQTAVTFKFKSYAENGLLFLMGTTSSYLSVELRDGKVLTQLHLGAEPMVVESRSKYNDGRWHTVEIARDRKIGLVKINQETEGQIQGGANARDTLMPEKVYFGGYPGEHLFESVTNIGFDGCIDHVEFESEPVDLTQSESFGVSPGCPTKVASIISFEEGNPGYVRWLNATSNNFLQLTLKIRTRAHSGLVFFATSRDQLSSFSLSMTEGRLVLRSQGQELGSDAQYNDGEWHVLTATHQADSLRLDIDDSDTFASKQAPPQLFLKHGTMYFGGVPSNVTLTSSTSAASNPFVGCLGDATVNGVIINFANSTTRPNAVMGKCVALKEGAAPVAPISPPDRMPDRVRPTTTTAPIVETEPPTTTLPPPTTTTPPPAQCMLPRRPATDPDQVEDSVRFGQVPWGRQEYNSVPGPLKKKFDFTVDFKTFVGEGVIFYVADKSQVDHIAVYMKEGKVYYSFNCGSGPSLVQSEGVYNDGDWHTLSFSRKSATGKLIIDDIEKVEGSSKGNTNTINVQAPFYIGGLNDRMANASKSNLGNVTRTFEGCLRNFKMGSERVVDLSYTAGTSPCSEKVEDGVFFSADGAYVRTVENFKVGLEIHIKLEIRPRSTNGILMSAHGKGDYFVLQMIDGAVKISVNNGKKAFFTTFNPPQEYYLCDGKWHSIEVIKSRALVTLAVDKISAVPGIGVGPTTTDITHPLFMGNHRNSNMRGFETSDKQYVGCMKNLIINEKLVKLTNLEVHGNVTRSSCPTI